MKASGPDSEKRGPNRKFPRPIIGLELLKEQQYPVRGHFGIEVTSSTPPRRMPPFVSGTLQDLKFG